MSGPVEPAAELRFFARNMRELYVALTAEGFGSKEALQIIASLIAANTTPPK